ncbi:troponin I, slow skeletal muscle-like [Carassius carassius]|uniref:troponin I, slow skeletal muscle-like n=1 Tax=Carassius carassius TaxID=217509 RepID=UPI002869235A|nr:troponin I, slow skeletal muscle-like [Carassius carassius]
MSREGERARAQGESSSGLSVQELTLQQHCKDLHHKIDVIDEEHYDIGIKVTKNDKEIQEMNQKIYEMKSKLKRPNLKGVKLSAEHMLSVLLGSKHSQSIDFKANLKTVKKEEEKKEEVTDWRKNVEALSEMEGRKKLFDAGQWQQYQTKDDVKDMAAYNNISGRRRNTPHSSLLHVQGPLLMVVKLSVISDLN